MATSSNRVISRYSAFSDAQNRWPEWRVETTRLYGLGELFDLDTKIVLVDPSRFGPAYAVAHAVAHLDLGHVSRKIDSFTRQQEQDAHDLATLRLDQEGTRECA